MESAEKERFIENIIEKKGEWLRIMAKTHAPKDGWQDLEQEIFMALWVGLDGFGGRSSLETWLYSVVQNTAIDFYRRQESLRKRDARIYPDPGFVEQNHHEMRLVEEFTNVLGYLDRQVFMMYLDDIGYREMSSRTGINEVNLRKRLSRIKEQFKARYSGI